MQQDSTDQPSLYALISALLFAAQQPLSLEDLQQLVNREGEDTEPLSAEQIEVVLHQLQQTLSGSGIELSVCAKGYRVQVVSECLPWVHQMYRQRPPKLSRALLETLVIIAHQQPITRAEIEAIRGVNVSSQIMKQLKTFGWIKSPGVKEVPGYPALWITTAKLLEDLGLGSKQALIDHLEQIVQDCKQDEERSTPRL